MLNMVITAKKIRKDSNLVSLVLCLVSCVLCLAQLTDTATAATYYVDASNGKDENIGDSTHPWKTLDRAYTWYSGSGPKVHEGDTVLFKNGNYGTFKENTGDNPGEAWLFYRNNWITYKAAPGHTPNLTSINIQNLDKWPPYENGRSYLIFDGFKVLEGVGIIYTSYVQIKNCNITTTPQEDKGLYAPYFIQGATGVGIGDSNYITIQGNDIHNVCRGISGGGGHNHIYKDNQIHRIGEDGISATPNSLLIENNLIYDIDERRTPCGIWGTLNGTFQVGETVIQAGTGAEGIIQAVVAGSSISVFQTGINKFDTASHGAGTVTGQTSGATYSNVSRDYSHTDGIQIHGDAENITVTGNRIIRSWMGGLPGQGIKLASYAGQSLRDVVFTNNFIATGKPMILNGVHGMAFNNNTMLGSDGIDLGPEYTVTINTMYNNIIESLKPFADNTYGTLQIVSHGNNIFGNLPGIGTGPAYPFVVNNTELVNYNISSLFVNAANNDFNLAPNSAAINFGNPSYAPATDILGRTRVGRPDAGCYESSSNLPPNAEAGADQTLVISDPNNPTMVVLLDGSASNDPDGRITKYEWYEIDPNDHNGVTFSTDPNTTLTLPAGQRTFELKVTDDSNATDTDRVTVTILLANGLIKYLQFNDGSGAVASDSTLLGDPGRLINGPSWTAAGEIGFDGNKNAVEIPTSRLDPTNGTITLWANPDNFSKNRHFLFSHVKSQSNRIQLYCDASGSLNAGLGDNASLSSSIQTLNTHDWYHIALVWDGSIYTTYVDGVQKATGPYSGLNNLQTYADIGNTGNRSARTEGFDGLIDEVCFYNIPLSADEISDLALNFPPIGDKIVGEGEELCFTVRAKSGTIVELSDQNLPHIPSFASNVLRWTPGYDDAGTYELEFTSPHGSNLDFERVTVTVRDTQQENPVGHWTFNESSGDTASDISTSNNTGILRNGLAWDNGAITLSVPNDAVEIQTTGFNPHTGTIAMRVYPERYTLSKHYLFGHSAGTSANRVQLYLEFGSLCLGLGNSHDTSINIQQLQTQQWYHITLTWNPTTYNVYVDGQLKASGAYSGLSAFAANAEIGNNGITRDKALNGKIDEVIIYNRALSADEIAQLAN
jgi:hypothetical protein